MVIIYINICGEHETAVGSSATESASDLSHKCFKLY